MTRLLGGFLPLLLLAGGLAAGGGGAAAADECPAGPQVTIKDYIVANNTLVVCGHNPKNDSSVEAFQGIRYAEAPRWRSPQPEKPNPGPEPTVVHATNYRAICPQPGTYDKKPQPIGTEDCLYLNVWKPADADGSTPVMVFIHGGAFVVGSSADVAWTIEKVEDGVAKLKFDRDGGLYNGYSFARNGVILVTLNYRLGAPGFLFWQGDSRNQGKDYALKNKIYGSLGIQDQTAAIQWVHDNIAAFGGDPERITVFGESAGAMSVGLHLFSGTESNPLFQAAIMESNPMGLQYRSASAPESAVRQGDNFLANLCNRVGKPACAAGTDWALSPETVSINDIVAAQDAMAPTLKDMLADPAWNNLLPWSPILGSANGADDAGLSLLDHQPLDGYGTGLKAKPLFWGTNRDEGLLFSCLIDKVLKGTLAPFEYDAAITALFKPADAAWLVAQAETANLVSKREKVRPYCAGEGCLPQYENIINHAENALSNVGTDFVFRCANLRTAAKAADTEDANGHATKVASYIFTNGPVVKAFENANLCNRAFDGDPVPVCHGYELPFVFNTIGNFDESKRVKDLPAGALAAANVLAAGMNRDWAAFASHPGGFAPTSGVYAKGLTVRYGNQLPWGGGDDVDVATAAHCDKLWYGKVNPR